jgi:hypothetical protein
VIEEEDFEPNPRIHRASMFICHENGCELGYREAPERIIASGLLEEIGEWHYALKELEHRDVPVGVTEALKVLHDAACGWMDWLERRDTPRARTVASPPPPDEPKPAKLILMRHETP